VAREDTSDYRSLFVRDVPLIDTRAPVEFARGAFPTAVNLPLLTDDERHQVGIRYKESGQAAAIELGHQLVAGEVRDERTEAWCRFAREHPEGYIYCFRGGLRSSTAREWMGEAGVDYPLVIGGYKAMRRFLLEELERSVGRARFLLVAGKTGVGKTRVIDALPMAVDLEGLARHRGSSFGRLLDPQPSQIDFENALSIALMRKLHASAGSLVLEDEGKLVGRVSLPPSLREKMRSSGLLLVEESVAARVQVIFEDYVLDLGQRYGERHGDKGPALHSQHLREGLARISKRLGGVLYREVEELMQRAFDGAPELHRQWIEMLLVKYYDPMYEYQIQQREGEVVARGSRDDIIRIAGEFTGQ
jgi:tRNA 2-selenouridine synthase